MKHTACGFHLVVHDGVDEDSDAVLGEDLLGRDLVGGGPHVDLDVDVHAGDHEEDAGPRGAARQEAAEAEDDGSLVLLHHLDREQEAEGEGDEDEEDGGHGQQVGAQPRALLARCGTIDCEQDRSIYIQYYKLCSYMRHNDATIYILQYAVCFFDVGCTRFRFFFFLILSKFLVF